MYNMFSSAFCSEIRQALGCLKQLQAIHISVRLQGEPAPHQRAPTSPHSSLRASIKRHKPIRNTKQLLEVLQEFSRVGFSYKVKGCMVVARVVYLVCLGVFDYLGFYRHGLLPQHLLTYRRVVGSYIGGHHRARLEVYIYPPPLMGTTPSLKHDTSSKYS